MASSALTRARPRPKAFVRRWLPARVATESELRPLHLRDISLNWVRARRDYHYRLHRHAHYELLIPLRGVYRCVLNGNRFAVSPGRLLFVQQGDLHEDFYRQGNDFAACLFNLHAFSGGLWPHGVFAAHGPASARSIPLAKGSALASLAAMILAEGRARRHPSIAVEALAEAFFWLLVETRPIESLATPFRHHLGKSVFRRRLYEYFALNLREKPGMSAMAAELGMSERSLHARCRAVLGASPARAFSAYRIHEAKRFLARGLQVQEVSRALGFVDPFHFSKVFKRHLGFSPSRFSHDRTS